MASSSRRGNGYEPANTSAICSVLGAPALGGLARAGGENPGGMGPIDGGEDGEDPQRRLASRPSGDVRLRGVPEVSPILILSLAGLACPAVAGPTAWCVAGHQGGDGVVEVAGESGE